MGYSRARAFWGKVYMRLTVSGVIDASAAVQRPMNGEGKTCAARMTSANDFVLFNPALLSNFQHSGARIWRFNPSTLNDILAALIPKSTAVSRSLVRQHANSFRYPTTQDNTYRITGV